MIRPKNIFYALLSGILLGAAWYPPLTLLIFVGFVPLLLSTSTIHNSEVRKKSLRIWSLSFFAFLIWNIVATWWVYKASFEGALLAIGCNSLLMSWVFLLWYKTETRIFGGLKFWLLIPIWLAWEYGHTLWDLTWTWLTLGNSFSNMHNLVQWYEFTGVSGGSLWALSVSVLLCHALIKEEKGFRAYLRPLTALAAPMLLSVLILAVRHIDTVKKINVTIIQPNIDPYNSKFNESFAQQLGRLHQQLIERKPDPNTELVVLPETFIIDDIDESNYRQSADLNNTITLMKVHFPKAAILTGASSMHVFADGEQLSSTARKFYDSDRYFDAFNTAIYIDTARRVTFYHKSKLVPGVERMPFPAIFKYFEKYAIDLGGTSGSIGTQDERTVFNDNIYGYRLAPCICYESVYGDFMGSYMRGGAQAIAIITNDGWWGTTPGHRQHLSYAKLRAIESRKQIARSANTGISCFIDEFGTITQPQPYWEFAVINGELALNDVRTFFVRFGDLLSYASVLVTGGLFAFGFVLRFRRSVG